MYKKSTLDEKHDYCNVSKKETGLKPKKETLSFLCRFARIYHAENQLPAQLSGMVLN